MTRYWIALFLLTGRLGAQTAGVSLTNRDTRAIMVLPGSPGAVTFTADPSPGGGDLFQIVLSKAGSTVSMVLPDGSEMNSSNALPGYTFSAVRKGVLNDSYIPSPLVVNGDQTLIQLPASAPPGQYQLKVDAAESDGAVLVIASYFSSSPVRAGLMSNAPVYSVGDTVVFSGFVFDGAQPMASATAAVGIVDPRDAAAAPVEVKLTDSGTFDADPGDGVYTGTYKPTKPGIFTAALRAAGTSNSGLAFSRTATTTFRVQPPLAKFDALRDFAVDDDGDGVIDRVAINAKINTATEGSYQFAAALVTSSGARLQSKSILALTKGNNNVNLYFPGASVTALGEEGPYAITDDLLIYQDDPEGLLADTRTDAGKTAAYAIRGRVSGLQATPARLDFGNVSNGSAKDLTVIIQNSGTTPVLESVLPTNSTAFSVLNPKLPIGIAAGEEQTVTVRFAPATTGTFAGKLVVAGLEIPLSGSSASGPSIDLAPATLDFGSVTTGQTKDLTFNVSNRGIANLVVSTVTTSDPQFAVTSPGGGFTVAPSAAQTVTVRFAPASVGVKSASINVASNDSTRPASSIAVAGIGVQGANSAPGIGVTPSLLDFGSVSLSQTRDLSLTISNTGNVALSISALSVTGAAFRVVSPAAPLTIAASASQPVTVRFSPASAGQQTGTLVIASNDPARPSVSVGLSGSATGPAQGPAIEVVPATLDFGSVALGAVKEMILTVRNNGTARLDVSSVTSSNPRFAIAGLSSAFSVSAASSLAVTIRFTPATAGAQTGTLTFASNDAARPSVTASMTGTGSAASSVSTLLSVDDGSFEVSTGVPDGAPAVYFVNRLTPTSYPATLKSVQIAFMGGSDSLREGDTIRILVATNPSGSSVFNGAQFLAATARVGPAGQFSSYDTPAVTISSGDFLVGFVTVNPANIFPAALDTTPPSRQRSYVSLDGVAFTLLDSIGSAGNFGIRVGVETSQPAFGIDTASNAAVEFSPLAIRPGLTIDLRDALRTTRPTRKYPPLR